MYFGAKTKTPLSLGKNDRLESLSEKILRLLRLLYLVCILIEKIKSRADLEAYSELVEKKRCYEVLITQIFFFFLKIAPGLTTVANLFLFFLLYLPKTPCTQLYILVACPLVVGCGMPPQLGLTSSAISAPRI